MEARHLYYNDDDGLQVFLVRLRLARRENSSLQTHSRAAGAQLGPHPIDNKILRVLPVRTYSSNWNRDSVQGVRELHIEKEPVRAPALSLEVSG